MGTALVPRDRTRADFRLLMLLVSVLLVPGCDESSPTGPTVPLNREFVLAPGEVASIESTSVRIRFVSVLNDSRCPADAFCIQGGDAIVRIEVIDGGTRAYDLHTGSLEPVRDGNYTIALVQLVPYPFSSTTIPPGDYRATFKITR